MLTVIPLQDPVGVISPRLALVLHTNEDSGVVGCVTKHTITNGLIQAGTYIAPSEVVNLLSDDADSGLTYRAPTIIAESTKYLVWYRPSIIRPMWFRTNRGNISYKVKWPSLLFVANKSDRKLQVFALGYDRYPKPTDAVYHAPLMNLYSDGGVCQGTAKLPKNLTSSHLNEIEATIYDSNFTHVNHQKTLSKKVCDACDTKAHLQYWQRKNNSSKNIPLSDMNRYCTLSGLLEKLK